MIEGIAMLTVLAGMGIYFVKSTDLTKRYESKKRAIKTRIFKNSDDSSKEV